MAHLSDASRYVSNSSPAEALHHDGTVFLPDDKQLPGILSASRLMQGISPEALNALLPFVRIRQYERGGIIFSMHDLVTDINLIISGRVKTVFYARDGREDIRKILVPGLIVGIDVVCTESGISPYQAVATEDSVICSFPLRLLTGQAAVNAQCPEQSNIASAHSMAGSILNAEEQLICLRNLLSIISTVNMQNEYRLEILSRRGIRDRIMVYLTLQASKRDTTAFTIPFSRDEMASFLCVDRSALSHELSLMRAEGLIDFRLNEFVLLRRGDEM